MFGEGSSFWILPEPLPHLWFVISDPVVDADCILIANLTSYDPMAPVGPTNDPACVLVPGEHPFVVQDTCVAYYYAQQASDQYLTYRLEQGKIKLDERASPALLAKMRERAGSSRYMSTDNFQILLGQNLA